MQRSGSVLDRQCPAEAAQGSAQKNCVSGACNVQSTHRPYIILQYGAAEHDLMKFGLLKVRDRKTSMGERRQNFLACPMVITRCAGHLVVDNAATTIPQQRHGHSAIFMTRYVHVQAEKDVMDPRALHQEKELTQQRIMQCQTDVGVTLADIQVCCFRPVFIGASEGLWQLHPCVTTCPSAVLPLP